MLEHIFSYYYYSETQAEQGSSYKTRDDDLNLGRAIIVRRQFVKVKSRLGCFGASGNGLGEQASIVRTRKWKSVNNDVNNRLVKLESRSEKETDEEQLEVNQLESESEMNDA